jgi:hypothetical protein
MHEINMNDQQSSWHAAAGGPSTRDPVGEDVVDNVTNYNLLDEYYKYGERCALVPGILRTRSRYIQLVMH